MSAAFKPRPRPAPNVALDPTTVGTAFLTIGVVMLLLEVTMPGFFIGIPATILLVLGVLAFIAPEFALSPVWAPIIVVVVGVPTTLATIFAYRKLAPADKPPTTTAGDSLLGREATVITALVPGSMKGKVRVDRQVWSATADEPIPVDTRVIVARVDGVILLVQRKV